MESDGDGQPQKKRRVTRACDQCRRKRIKCDSYPRAAIDSPCVICTEAGQADQCTYSRPAKKRGPQAGRARTLEEKCAVFERLMGYLLAAVPNLEAHVSHFIAQAQGGATSPSSSTPGDDSPAASTSSAISPAALAAQHQQRYTSSRIAELLESVLPPPISAREAAKQGKRESSSAAKDEDLASGLASIKYPSPAASLPLPPVAGFPYPPAFPQPAELPDPFSYGAHAGPSSFPLALQTLAEAAVPDAAASAFASGGGKGKGREVLVMEDPALPDGVARSALLDLYFNQVVQPVLPMLDKSRFLRWSAHLPASQPSTSSSTSLIPPSLYYAVFALASSYISPSSPFASSLPPNATETYARAARTHLVRDVFLDGTGGLSVENVQSAAILALVDWGAGQLDRAWMMSALALSLALSLSLHLSTALAPDPSSYKLKTFHSILIIHVLLSLRLGRPPLTVLEDYDVPIPPVDDEAINWDLWRSDKSAAELRAEWGDTDSASDGTDGGPVTAVRNNSLVTFARLASLCAIALNVLRWNVCPRRGNGQGLPAGEAERAELVASLGAWEEQLEMDLRLGDARGGVELVRERARWIVEMHLVAAALHLKLRPHPSFASVAVDPIPRSLGLLNHVLGRYRSTFTLYRSLPSIDLVLHLFSETLFDQSDYAPHHHDTVLRAYAELAKVFPVAQKSWVELAAKVDGHKRELGLLRGVHPTTSIQPPPPALPAPAPIAEPFQAFLSYSNDLGPSANPSTILDFGSWDQSDLLVSLGLVGPAAGSKGTWTPLEGWGGPEGGMPVPMPIEGAVGYGEISHQHGQSLAPQPATLPPPPAKQPAGAGASSSFPMVISPASTAPTGDSTAYGETSFAGLPYNIPSPSGGQVDTSASTFPYQSFAAANTPSSSDSGGPATDLLTRWIDRGSLGFGGAFEAVGEGGAG
ncbi:Zn(2)-C6 fungal-type domain-containing protein [Rhodotorula toruloides]|uniref:Zn(2)-C6 fungal-type domain-containing protein n=1 Tax=Rhodotorula toruloides TaxID=5286 RepID=A0A2T0ACB5_RHOTO|nr:Zn(2)-C6 fungal-type domain-containing protein [Rhodotorula toruloides]PRQ75648.1 hypothetical protein AAT19DRAFT_13705 [Rhodotorula toruloides]